MNELRSLLAGSNADVGLDRAALQLATIEYPGLDVELFLHTLDSHAVELAALLPENCGGEQYISIANHYLFTELGFGGNSSDYYDPRNSCLNEVLARRTGIPITLSVVYMEIARRLSKPVYGVGMPGHFLVLYDDREYRAFVDPFYGGRLLSPGDCRERARTTAGVDIDESPQSMQPVSNRHILIRMLNNLRAVYAKQEAHAKSVEVLGLLLEASPNSAEERRERGRLNIELHRYQAAREDLEAYLRLAPEAPDRATIEKTLAVLRQWTSRLN